MWSKEGEWVSRSKFLIKKMNDSLGSALKRKWTAVCKYIPKLVVPPLLVTVL